MSEFEEPGLEKIGRGGTQVVALGRGVTDARVRSTTSGRMSGNRPAGEAISPSWWSMTLPLYVLRAKAIPNSLHDPSGPDRWSPLH